MNNVYNGKPSVCVLWLVTFVSDSIGSNVKTLKSDESEGTRQEAIII